MEAIGYIRVSSLNSAHHADEIATQKHKILGYLGHEPTQWFCDAGVSSLTEPMTRAGFADMMMVVEDDPHRIIAGSRDRFGRHNAFTAVREYIEAMDCTMEDPATGVHDLSPQRPAEWLMDGILTLFSEYERRVIVDRLGSGKSRAKAEGRYLGGKTPFGFRVEDGNLVEVPTEQAIIEQINESTLSIRDTAAMLGIKKHIVESVRRNAQ